MSNLLSDLTPVQVKAVTTIHGPLLVIAGAGSGKTRVITRRIGYMIESGISADSILAITFTNKAAGEMAERVSHLVSGRRPHVSTFHSFCAKVLRQKATYAGLESTYVIYDTSDSRSLIKNCILELNYDPKYLDAPYVAHVISDCKNKLISPADFEKNSSDTKSKQASKVYEKYQQTLLQCNAVDFDDLLLLVLKIFIQHPVVLEEYQEQYRYILVDEYQDTNTPQHQLVKLLGSKYKNVCVTGDPDQTIYSWRGANITNINSFPDEYPGAAVVNLEQNFRSTNNILKAANAIITNNSRRFQKKLFSELGDGEKLKLSLVEDESDESEFVVKSIKNLIKDGAPLKGIAVFYRTNGQSRALEDVLSGSSIPYTIVGGTKFYDRAEIKDMVAYLRLIENGRDNISLLRVINTPTRGLGPKAVQTIKDFALSQSVSLAEALTHSEIRNLISGKALSGIDEFLNIFSAVFEMSVESTVADKIRKIYEVSGYQKYLQSDAVENADRIENIESLFHAAMEFSKKTGIQSISGFLENISLIADIDSWEDKEEKITLMTLHAAKGLEFDHVFMIGCEEGLLPHKNNIDSDVGLEEERRLCYVGVTRARKTLTLTSAQMRMQWGSPIYSRKSRFINEIPETLFANASSKSVGGSLSSGRKSFSLMQNWQSKEEETVRQKFEKKSQQEPEFNDLPQMITAKQGDIVRHPQFGKGIVIKVDGEGEDSRITVIFESAGTKTLIAQYSRLQKI